ncbi:PH domain-containing protein [Clostridium sp. DJ247]|uniref:PH domain-containing protein n=1 Tax=Clostridium sp. DJ247 TaxID=2726188 RepID=UPI001629331D|nr:PH domain-containing protein [Clostridium sp. DJ247]MBC2579227.1 hypothetical protein [Clostridium sp. DJ247]MBC2579322.1 hypothetical protein [Clostridium sp. DJ247]
METYKSTKGLGIYSILGITILYNTLLIALFFLINSYEISILLKVAIVIFNIYQIYYILIYSSLSFFMDKDNLYITSVLGLKKIKIPFNCIQGYRRDFGYIKGVRLSGYGKNNFAIGRSIIDKIGNTYMFVTSTKNVIYIKTDETSYGISPENIDDFEKKLNENNISYLNWDYKINKGINIYKDKRFYIPLIIVTIITLLVTLNPIVLYLYHKLPPMMPLSFNSQFIAIKFGTGKQFAFKHMFYGILNMAVLFCMYYAAYFCARYDRKSAYKFIYIPLILSTVFLIMQIRILVTFR